MQDDLLYPDNETFEEDELEKDESEAAPFALDGFESEDEFDALPDIDLSPTALFERFGLEHAPVDKAEETLPALVEEKPVDIVGVLPDPFADEETKAEAEERAWYIIHCYSGYEHKVKHNLEQRIESMGMHDYIFQVVVPTVEEIEIRDGKRRTVERCLYPGYIMVQLLLTDDSWYVVRNTPGVTGFVGMGNTPTPLRSEAVQGILRRMEAAAPQVRATFKPGQKVRIIEGPFADFIGTVDDIDEERTKVRVLVSFFGRETPVELDFLQVERA
jgi:transcription termination/antitermination protein NusG